MTAEIIARIDALEATAMLVLKEAKNLRGALERVDAPAARKGKKATEESIQRALAKRNKSIIRNQNKKSTTHE